MPEDDGPVNTLSKVYDVLWLNGRSLVDRDVDDKELEMLEELIYK
jgi:hypothetical protein